MSRVGASSWLVAPMVAIGLLAAACGDGETVDPLAGVLDQAASDQVITPPTATTVQTQDQADEVDQVDDADQADEVDAEAEIRASFERYRNALLDQDPAAAVAVVNQRTFEVYQDILIHSLDADATDLLEELPLSVAFNVFASRAFIGGELLEVADGRALFELGVERGLVGDDVAAIEITGVEIVDGVAHGLVGGEPALRFEWTGTEWLVDVAYVSEFAFDRNEAVIISALTGGIGTSRADLFESFSPAFGSSWAELSQPLR